MSPLYATVLEFCLAQLDAAMSRPLVVGIQGPQGAGKSTLTRALLEQLEHHRASPVVERPPRGLRAVTISIDDFYLTHAQQLALAEAFPGNPYMEHRGYPGTHDVPLGATTLDAIRHERTTRVPSYDKSAHHGRGDRRPQSEWPTTELPIDILFVEGWMLGFTPVPESSLSDANLVPANRALAAYDAWYQYIDAWVVLRALDSNYVLSWRVEAEERMKASGKPGLTREEIEDYIRRFLPAYATWGQTFGVARGKRLELNVGFDRNLG